MTIDRLRSIDDLYAEVADADLVVVPDVALASALNRRIRTPRFGPFAVTPRRLAAPRRETPEDRDAFLQLVDPVDLDWKDLGVAIDEVLQCWEHTERAETILSYPTYDTPATREIVQRVDELTITSSQLAETTIDPDQHGDVAVIAPDLLTPLQASVLPPTVRRVDLFANEPFEFPPVRLFASPAAAVGTLVDRITPANANDVGVVLEAGSTYAQLLETALEARGIPYHGGPDYTDDGGVRAVLACLRIARAGSNTRIGDVRPFLERLGIDIDLAHDEKRLAAVDTPGLERIRAFRDGRTERTLEEAVTFVEDRIDGSLDHLRRELDRIGLTDAPITARSLERLRFYLATYDVPVDRDDEGVVLANPTAAAYVDRPLVFCLGLDEGWTHDVPRRPWIDRERTFARNRRRFETIIQSGSAREYFVVDATDGRPVPPTMYLDDVERFSDLPSRRHTRPPTATNDGFERQDTPTVTPPEPTETLSQTELGGFVTSPRDHAFDELVDRPDAVPLEEGTLLHDFAEFYVAHPELVEDADGRPDPERLRACAAFMIERTGPFYGAAEREATRTRYRAALETITAFVRTRVPDPETVHTDLERPDWADNAFAEHFGVDLDASITELRFEDADLGLRGMIDLLAGPDHIVDFKRGARNTTGAVLRSAALDPPASDPDFQVLAYLSFLRSRRPDRELTFSFVHVFEALDDAITGTPNVEDCVTEIRYLPTTYAEYVRSEDCFAGLCEEAANDCNKTFSKASFDTWRSVLDAVDLPPTRDADELIDSAFNEHLTERMRAAVGEYKYVTKGCKQACRHLAGLRCRYVFADDLDAFERFVADRIEELETYRAGEERFPVAGLGGEPEWRYVSHRDMLLEDEIPIEERIA